MENSFDHARAFLVQFFQNHPTGLDNNSAVKLMTDYAAHFITGEVVSTVSDDVSDLEAKFKAKVEELEQTIQNLTQAHKEELNALQTPSEPATIIVDGSLSENIVETEETKSPKKRKK